MATVPPIRPASAADAPFLAKIMLLASRSHLERGPWDIALNGTEATRLSYLERLALVEDQCPTHYKHFLVAEVNGRPAAAVCGYDPPNVSAKLFGGEAMVRAGIRGSAALAQVFGALDRVAWREDLEPSAWIIESMATLPEFRRRGVMTALLPRILDVGRGHGCRFARVHVFIGNTSAEAIYAKAGFASADNPKSDPTLQQILGSPGMKLLKRPL